MNPTTHTPEKLRELLRGIEGRAITVSERAELFGIIHDYANRIEADESARIGWDKECEDADRIIEKLGLTVERARTEGGCLHLPRILNHIQETLDALAVAEGFGKSMVGKYVDAVHAANHPPAQINERAVSVDENRRVGWLLESVDGNGWWDGRATELLREWGLDSGEDSKVSTPFIERLRCFVCHIFGHRFYPGAGWVFAGKLYCVCDRCNQLISEPTDRRTPEQPE